MALKTLATATALATLAVAANAATLEYELFDHPDGSNSGFAEYGIRLDAIGLYFSFEPDSDATLSINTDDDTAAMMGTVVANNAGSDDLGLWTIDYSWSNINVTDETNGYFISDGGSGTITDGMTTYLLQGMGKNDPDWGYNFQFGEDHRLSDAEIENGFGPAEGWGWINVGYEYDYCENGPQPLTVSDDEPCSGTYWYGKDGANDFLFTAQLGDGGDNPDGEVPLPAAGWMLLAGLGGLRLMKRKRV